MAPANTISLPLQSGPSVAWPERATSNLLHTDCTILFQGLVVVVPAAAAVPAVPAAPAALNATEPWDPSYIVCMADGLFTVAWKGSRKRTREPAEHLLWDGPDCAKQWKKFLKEETDRELCNLLQKQPRQYVGRPAPAVAD